MNNVEAIDRHLPRNSSVARAHDEAEALQDLGAFGWLRGVRDRAVMLELRQKDGGIVAFPYAWLERADGAARAAWGGPHGSHQRRRGRMISLT